MFLVTTDIFLSHYLNLAHRDLFYSNSEQSTTSQSGLLLLYRRSDNLICVTVTFFMKLPDFLYTAWASRTASVHVFCLQNRREIFIDPCDRGSPFKQLFNQLIDLHPLLSTGADFISRTAPTGEGDFTGLYSLTPLQHIFMQYDVNLFFLWKWWGYFVTVSGIIQ